MVWFQMDIQGLIIDHYTTVQTVHYYYFEQIQKYIEYTNDYEFIKEKIYDKLKK